VDLLSGTAVAVSDGSFYRESRKASAAWIVASADGREFIKGGGLIPGPARLHSAYRSELGGLLGISIGIFALHNTAKLHNLLGRARQSDTDTHPPITIACDGKTALFQAFHSSVDSTSLTWKHFDILTSIIGWWSHIPYSPRAQHVKGHQDSHKCLDDLSLLEQILRDEYYQN
jgi:hypothetical protein